MSDRAGAPPDLGIALDTIATVADLLNALEEDAERAEEEPVGFLEEEFDEEDEEIEGESVSTELLEALIDELSEPEQAALIALALVGRGDHEPEEWPAALAAARQRLARSDAAEYLLDLPGAGELLADGLAAFGIAIEGIPR
ncbi:MAG: DUF3775 domain-containing protein [Rhodovarius sp.]|nr:DUF3775 domain-containing protein [Rhodovarius sp.]MCX7932033.1 DUF3775 domain-containing protein [Rhodovarius sp.]MDW8313763.1 DUF3775 domain-containing protein [Rhodovarius sp.]